MKNCSSQAYCIYFNIKIINSQQAKVVYDDKNTTVKPFKTSAAIWCNKICKTNHLYLKYINVKVKGINPQNINKRQAAIRYMLNQKLKFYIKRNKNSINNCIWHIQTVQHSGKICGMSYKHLYISKQLMPKTPKVI